MTGLSSIPSAGCTDPILCFLRDLANKSCGIPCDHSCGSRTIEHGDVFLKPSNAFMFKAGDKIRPFARSRFLQRQRHIHERLAKKLRRKPSGHAAVIFLTYLEWCHRLKLPVFQSDYRHLAAYMQEASQ